MINVHHRQAKSQTENSYTCARTALQTGANKTKRLEVTKVSHACLTRSVDDITCTPLNAAYSCMLLAI